jgi:hypothetical protein
VTRWRAALIVTIAVLASGCAGGDTQPPSSRLTGDVPLPVTAPYLLMSNATTGVAVWPSGSAWLLLSTSDGFAHVTNRTPIGVETDGGLTLTVTGAQYAVAVGAHDRLVRSPLLSAGADWRWSPDELPGAVSGARGAVAYSAAGLTAVLSASPATLVHNAGDHWPALATPAQAAGGHLDSVTWSGRLGWLTGHGPAGTTMAYRTTDSGAHWAPIDATRQGIVAALAPCQGTRSWLMPVIAADGTERILRTADAGQHWQAGAAEPTPSGAPAWGCLGEQVWLAAGGSDGDRIVTSNDEGGHWNDRGQAPPGLSDLTPTGAGVGYAASDDGGPQLWRVTGAGSRFTRIPLPPWVANLGSGAGAN